MSVADPFVDFGTIGDPAGISCTGAVDYIFNIVAFIAIGALPGLLALIIACKRRLPDIHIIGCTKRCNSDGSPYTPRPDEIGLPSFSLPSFLFYPLFPLMGVILAIGAFFVFQEEGGWCERWEFLAAWFIFNLFLPLPVILLAIFYQPIASLVVFVIHWFLLTFAVFGTFILFTNINLLVGFIILFVWVWLTYLMIWNGIFWSGFREDYAWGQPCPAYVPSPPTFRGKCVYKDQKSAPQKMGGECAPCGIKEGEYTPAPTNGGLAPLGVSNSTITQRTPQTGPFTFTGGNPARV